MWGISLQQIFNRINRLELKTQTLLGFYFHGALNIQGKRPECGAETPPVNTHLSAHQRTGSEREPINARLVFGRLRRTAARDSNA